MHDITFLGMLAGLTGGTVGITFSYLLFKLGVNTISTIHLGSALTLTDYRNLTPAAFILAVFTYLAVAGGFGILLAYFLRYTGKDHFIAKGILMGTLFCILFHSYLIPLLRTDIDFKPNPAETLATYGAHAIIGLVTAIVITRYGKLKNQVDNP